MYLLSQVHCIAINFRMTVYGLTPTYFKSIFCAVYTADSVENVVKKKCPDLPNRCLDLVSYLYTHWEDMNNTAVQGDLLLQV
jgi:hypothetical protein